MGQPVPQVVWIFIEALQGDLSEILQFVVWVVYWFNWLSHEGKALTQQNFLILRVFAHFYCAKVSLAFEFNLEYDLLFVEFVSIYCGKFLSDISISCGWSQPKKTLELRWPVPVRTSEGKLSTNVLSEVFDLFLRLSDTPVESDSFFKFLLSLWIEISIPENLVQRVWPRAKRIYFVFVSFSLSQIQSLIQKGFTCVQLQNQLDNRMTRFTQNPLINYHILIDFLAFVFRDRVQNLLPGIFSLLYG